MRDELIEDAWTIDLGRPFNNETEGLVKAADLPFKEKLSYKIGTHFIYNPLPKKQ